MKSNYFLTLLSFFFLSQLKAELVLVVDTANTRYWVTGSDTGNLNSSSNAFWSNVNGIIVSDAFFAASPEVASGNNVNYSYNNSELAIQNSDSSLFFGIQGFDLDSGSITFTGTGSSNKVNYSSASNAVKTALANAIGNSLAPLTQASQSAWSAISVQAVPEPSIYGLLSASLCLLYTLRILKI